MTIYPNLLGHITKVMLE